MDPNKLEPKQRLQLNFQGYNTDRTFQPANERVFPTTPSTFPQPVFGNQGATTPNAYVNAQAQSPYAAQQGQQGGGYFPQYNQNQQSTSPYQAQGQGAYPTQYQQQNLAAPQPSYQQQRLPAYNLNDPTSGLAHQFSNQNLGAPQRQGSPFGRQPSPNARQYANNQQAQIQPSRSPQNIQRPYLSTPPLQDPNGQNLGGPTTEEPPEKRPEKYSANVGKRGNGLHTFVEAFFKENISRARDRNTR